MADALGPVLREWDDFLATAPEIAEALRPGLDDATIDDLSAALDPYVLPRDLRELYRWHDGLPLRSDAPPMLLSAGFVPLEHAVMMRREGLQTGWWHPLLLSSFGWNGVAVELVEDAGREAAFLWSWHSHDASLISCFDSIASLFSTSLEGWRQGILPEAVWVDPRQWGLLHRMNPVSWVDEKVQRSELERWHAYDWPDRWLRAEGLTRPEPGPASAVTAVADLMAGGRPGTVRGPTTHGAGGDGDWEIRVLDDGTGRVRMLLSAERTAGFRTVDPERIEADLRPSDADAAADLPERTRGALGHDFVATRIAPLP